MREAIVVDEISKHYRIGELSSAYGTLRDSLSDGVRRLFRRELRPHYEVIWALKDVSFEVREGEVLGIVGRNGAGKSTMLKILTKITTPSSGQATIRGRVGSLLEVGTGFHPELTGRENIFLNGSVLGMKRREIVRKLPDIIEFAGVERFIDTPVKRYSSGMGVRLAFAVAAHLEPEILLVDEVLAVGDAEFQRRCLGRMEDISHTGRTVVFVSHNMQALTQLCDRAIWLDGGELIMDGPSSQVVARYLQSGYGIGAARRWEDVADAPGDELVRLRSIRALQDGVESDAADIRRPIGIEIGFTVLRHGDPVFPKIKVFDGQGNVAFNAMDTSPRWDEPTPPGDYVSTAWIPGNFLNEGLATVIVEISTLGAPDLRTRLTSDPIAFHVQDPGEGDSARGRFTGQWKGVVRPMLDWTLEEDASF